MKDEGYKTISRATTHPVKPEQEPVAWLHWLHGPVRLFLNKDEAMMELDRLNREYPVDKDARQMKPLYTTPPTQQSCSQRNPLTDEEIERIRIEQEFDQWAISEGAFKYAARAVEAAHGIKEKNTRNGGCL